MRPDRPLDSGFGWIAVACSFTAHFIGFGTLYSFTIFFPSMLEAFGEGRGATSWIASIAAGLMLGAGSITGKLSDRFGPGPMLAAGGVLMGAGLLLTSFATSIWQVYLSYGLTVGLGVSCAFVPSVATVGQWFGRRRGLAIGVAVAGTGIGSLVLAPLSRALIDASGWRDAMRVLALLSMLALLVAGATIKPRTRARPNPSARPREHDRVFALLFWGSLIASYGYWVPFVHIVPYAEDRGIPTAAAAALVGVMGIANTLGRVVMGALADRIGRHRMMQLSAAALTAALLAWPLAGDWGGLLTFGLAYGSFAGAFIALLPAVAGDYFGTEGLAGITGRLFSGAAVGSLAGAPVTGLLFDARGSYTPGIILAGSAMAAGAALMFMLPRPAPHTS